VASPVRPSSLWPSSLAGGLTAGLSAACSWALCAALVACEASPSPTDVGPSASSKASARPTSSALATGTSSGSASPSPSATAAPELEPLPTSAPLASASASASPSAAPSASASTQPSTQASTQPSTKPSAVASAKPTAPTATPTAAPSAALPPPAPGSAEAVAADVDAVFQPPKLFKAKFTQTYTLKVQNEKKVSSGTVFVEKPGKISIRYDAPKQDRVVSDGTTLKVYVAEDKVLYESRVQGKEVPGAMSFLMGGGIRPSFSFSFHDKSTFKEGPVLWGKPKETTAQYESVFFYVDKALLEKKDTGLMRRVLVLDAQGNRNQFDFASVERPASLDAGEFSFSPPAGTEIKKQ
jgi:outer membrane lipoprotein carrier protein